LSWRIEGERGPTSGWSGRLRRPQLSANPLGGTGVITVGRHDLVMRLPAEVAERLGHYVYLYVDPRTDRPFYVGKGKGERILAHFDDARDSHKTRTIGELRAAGLEPRPEVLAHRLKDEETALRIEAAAIDLLGLGELTNEVRGWRSLEMGRMTLDELKGYYAAKSVTVLHPALLIRINKLFRRNMTDTELYEATRGIWKLSERRAGARYALAVFEGVAREVYEIESWHPALTHPYRTRDPGGWDTRGRWEFVGKVAVDEIRDTYRLGSVRHYFKQGYQSPTMYVNC